MSCNRIHPPPLRITAMLALCLWPAAAQASTNVTLFPPSNECSTSSSQEFLSWQYDANNPQGQLTCSTGQQVMTNAMAATGGCSANQAVVFQSNAASNGTGVDGNNTQTYVGNNQYKCQTLGYYSYPISTNNSGVGSASATAACQPYEIITSVSGSCSAGSGYPSGQTRTSATYSCSGAQSSVCDSWSGRGDGNFTAWPYIYGQTYPRYPVTLSCSQYSSCPNPFYYAYCSSNSDCACTGYAAVSTTATVNATCEGLTWSN